MDDDDYYSSSTTTSAPTLTVTIPDPVATIDMSSMYSTGIDLSTITIGGVDTISFPDLTLNDINFTEFEGMLPPIEKVKEMCDEYPALEKAYENFKLIYKLVHDDWVSQKENPHG